MLTKIRLLQQSNQGYPCFAILRSILWIPAFITHTVKPVLSDHSKIDKTKILMTNGSLMKVESIAECSHWSILQYFWPALSENLSWKPNFGFFLSGRLRQVLLYFIWKLKKKVLEIFRTYTILVFLCFQENILWIVIGRVSLRRFQWVPTKCVFWEIIKTTTSGHCLILD